LSWFQKIKTCSDCDTNQNDFKLTLYKYFLNLTTRLKRPTKQWPEWRVGGGQGAGYGGRRGRGLNFNYINRHICKTICIN
jgi:hypothetical protein